MTLGMIVRADHTGLGNQTWMMWERLKPAATVVIVPTRGAGSGLTQHIDRYPADSLIVNWDPHRPALPDKVVDAFADCATVYSAETFYDHDLPRRLRAAGVRTVLHANPELYTAEEHVDEIWLPTSWLKDMVAAKIPDGTVGPVVMPMPVPTDYADPLEPDTAPKRIVHPTSTAMADRNGGATVDKALGRFRAPGRDVLLDPVGPSTRWLRNVRSVTHWWERDAGAWLSVIPRRYGGLCLPALEAMAAGVPVVMPDTSPQNVDWPCVVTVHSHTAAARSMKGGLISMVGVSSGELRSVVNLLLDAGRREKAAALTRQFAAENGPDQIVPRWLDRLQ